MQGYSPKLPLVYDPLDLYSTNKTPADTIKQDLKMLLFTNPGERVMMPNYGVGLRRELFNNFDEIYKQQLQNRIISQIKRYLSFIVINTVEVDKKQDSNVLSVFIEYFIPFLDTTDEINLSVTSN